VRISRFTVAHICLSPHVFLAADSRMVVLCLRLRLSLFFTQALRHTTMRIAHEAMRRLLGRTLTEHGEIRSAEGRVRRMLQGRRLSMLRPTQRSLRALREIAASILLLRLETHFFVQWWTS
jgi:hypothetical protein